MLRQPPRILTRAIAAEACSERSATLCFPRGSGEGKTIDEEHTYDGAYCINIGTQTWWFYPNNHHIVVDMSGLSMSGVRTLAPNEATDASIEVTSAVNLVDDSILSYCDGDVTVKTAGSLKMGTSRPSFVAPE